MPDDLQWLQEWKLRMWEQRPGCRADLSIESLSTEGWLVCADFRDLGFDASRHHRPRVENREGQNWLTSEADGPVLKIYCGPLMLNDAFALVRVFISDRERNDV